MTPGADNPGAARTWTGMTTRTLLFSLLCLSCTSDKTVVVIDGDPIDADGGRPELDGATDDDGGTPAVTEVDLLLVIDNSGSMAEEQASLADELPIFIRSLADGEIRDPDTGALVESFPPVTSLRVGVVSTDMGTGGFNVPTCTNRRFGDDGLLIDRGNVASDSRCMATYPTPQTISGMDLSDLEAVTDFVVDQACIAELGIDGCGFEQQLDAMLKAVTPASSTLTFQEGTPGNGTVNGNFGRPDAVLAVLMVTDEDDCSTFEPDLFNPTSSRYTGDLNLRCFNFPEAVHPLSRFRIGLLAGRDPERVVFMPITGIPARLEPSAGGTPDYATILADPDMQEVVDPGDDTRLLPSCNVPGRGLAFPPRRIVGLAQELGSAGAHASVASICQRDFGNALTSFTRAIADAMSAP